MARFQAGVTKVLVATTVIEVGVNVPNASIMVIERAEIFGLAQLHQLRGRVGRGSAASTCLLMYQAPLSETGERRLTVLRDTEDGFRIAEEDLAIETRENTLIIKGAKEGRGDEAGKSEVLHQGIAARAFERRFQLADHVSVTGASLKNGLLHVDLVREIPEASKPRRIQIGAGKLVEASKAA